eukprot:653489_1
MLTLERSIMVNRSCSFIAYSSTLTSPPLQTSASSNNNDDDDDMDLTYATTLADLALTNPLIAAAAPFLFLEVALPFVPVLASELLEKVRRKLPPTLNESRFLRDFLFFCGVGAAGAAASVVVVILLLLLLATLLA